MRPLCAPVVFAAAVLVSAGLVPAKAEDAPPQPIVRNEMRVLTADEVDRYLAAFADLERLGLDVAAEGDPSTPQQRAAALALGAKLQETIAKHGFDAQTFNEVHWNVVMAYMAGDLEEHRDEMEQARAQQQEMLAELRESLPPEQYEAAAQALQQMMPVLEVSVGAPPENRKIVAERRAELDALFDATAGESAD